METFRRPIVVTTTFGKTYYGDIDVPTESIRTTDLLNSNSIFWNDPNEKCFDNAILIHDAKLALEEKAIYKKFNKIQLKSSEIIFFFDNYETIGDKQEKARAVVMRNKAQEKMKPVTIITPLIANSFYDIKGKFYGLFKKKSQDKFIPLFDASVTEIKKVDNKWSQKRVHLAHTFLGISTQYIEALSFED
ncbi:hypothetical protein [Desulfogranum marinum]|uniref:hypothetical protein n=1 Tax=Desulfogranum marinum TaxID=453220 RepID=UPI001965E286|nr:hypothetical protein [Desulfogranum marinum]MBM9512377.1 hypothetical protein [Desulfogranum marinum]